MPEQPSSKLYSRSFVALLVVTLLAFGGYSTIQTILPLYAVHLGASATFLGIIVAAFSVPSVVLRPLLGALVDGWSRRGVHIIGTACLAVIGFLYIVPSVFTLIVVRFIHGAGWGAFNTAGGTAVAVLAPAARRGEASGIYNLMPGIANMVMPAISLLVLASQGFGVAFALASLLGVGAAVVLWVSRFPGDEASRQPALRAERPTAALERHAVLPMVIEFLFNTTQTLFWVYPPLFAAMLGVPIEGMTAYYVPVGITVVLSRLIVGRQIDRLSRRTAILLGAAAVGTALVVAATASSIWWLAAGGALHALSTSMISPTAMAMAIDGAAPKRRGASIATYSLGYQLGVGAGGLAWGAAIDAVGFSGTYLLALVGPLAIAVVVLRSRRLALGSSPRG